MDEHRVADEVAEFPAHSGSVRAARQLVGRELASCPGELVERAVLITSELATLAVQRSRSPFQVQISVGAGAVRVEVSDDHQRAMVAGALDLTDLSGHSRQVVEREADRWGTTTREHRSVLWFELDT